MKHSFLFLTLIFLLFACNKRDVYMHYEHVDKGLWHKDSVMNFDIEIEDTITPYNLYINIRNRSEYPYQNMWLFVETLSHQKVLSRDTIEFYLADNKGKWLGTGVGAAFEMPVLYRQNLRFAKKGIYNFKVFHGMRDTVLKGVNDVGLHLEKVSN